MWDVFSITEPGNKEKKWDLLLHRFIFPLEYVKRHLQILKEDSKEDQYIVQNLTWSGVYLMSNFSNNLLQKVLTLVPLKSTGPGVYVTTMTTFLSDSYYSLVDTLNHTKRLKTRDLPGGEVADCYDAILANVDSLDSARAFKPDHLGYIIRIFEDTSDSIFHLWETKK